MLESQGVDTTVLAPPLPTPVQTSESTEISGSNNRENITGTSKGKTTALIIGVLGFLLLGGVGAFAFTMMNQQQEFTNRLANIEKERQEAAKLKRQQDEENARTQEELQRQLEQERRLREEAEKRQRESNSNLNSSSNSSSNLNSFPEGTFTNNEWSITLFKRNNNIYYQAQSLKDSSSLNLQNGRTSGTNERRIYTWNNGAYRYQIIWQPKDPNFVRLRVFTPTSELLNQLLSRN